MDGLFLYNILPGYSLIGALQDFTITLIYWLALSTINPQDSFQEKFAPALTDTIVAKLMEGIDEIRQIVGRLSNQREDKRESFIPFINVSVVKRRKNYKRVWSSFILY
jgi:hypothetical protein